MTRQSIPTMEPFSPTLGSPAVFTDNSARMPMNPSTMPNAPPASVSRTLSVSNCPDDSLTATALEKRESQFHASAACGAQEQEISGFDIGTRDEENETDGAEQDQQGLWNVFDEGLSQGLDGKSVGGTKHIGKLPPEVRGGLLNLGFCFLQCDAGPQSPQRVEIMVLIGCFGVDLEGHPYIRRGAELAQIERTDRRAPMIVYGISPLKKSFSPEDVRIALRTAASKGCN